MDVSMARLGAFLYPLLVRCQYIYVFVIDSCFSLPSRWGDKHDSSSIIG